MNKESDIEILVRKLKNARNRALYWSGNATFVGKRFSVRKNHNGWEGYELAMCDVRGLCDQIEALGGKKLKQSDPKSDFVQRWSILMQKLADKRRAGSAQSTPRREGA